MGDAAGGIAQDPQLTRWLNLAVRTVWRSHSWPFTRKPPVTLTTTAGTPTVDLPADAVAVTKVYDATNNNPLRYRTDRVLRDYYWPSATGTPQFYTDGGFYQPQTTAPPVRRLLLYPTPDKTISLAVTYSSTPATMASEGDYSPLPEDFDEALLQWALVRYYNQADDASNANAARQAYADEISRLIGTYGVGQLERYARVDTPDYPTLP
jgi:hypothetical protein